MTQSGGKSRKVLLIAFITVVLDLIGFGIIIPIQPFYAEAFGASPTMVTLLGGSYSLMQFLFAPFWGRLSDRLGRRPIILVSVAASVVGYILFALADSLLLLFLSRMLSGFGNANIATAQAIIADTTSGEDRAKGMGLIGAAFGLGFILGPALGGFLGQYGLAVPAWGAAILGMGNWIFAFAFLPETYPPEARSAAGDTPSAHRRLAPWNVLPQVKRFPNVIPLVVMLLILTTGFALMEQALGLFIERAWVPEAMTATGDARTAALREAAALTSWLLVAVGVTAAIVQGGLIGPLSKRFGERNLARAGLVGLAASLAMIPVVGMSANFGWIFIPGVILAASTGLVTPSLNSLLSRSVSDHEQGAALGVGQSSSSLGRVLGPAASGVLFEWSVNMPFLVGAALMILALALSFRVGEARVPDTLDDQPQ